MANIPHHWGIVFQFQKVRLKDCRKRYNLKTYLVSIPKGTIKSAWNNFVASLATPFQFQKVRLKEPYKGFPDTFS